MRLNVGVLAINRLDDHQLAILRALADAALEFPAALVRKSAWEDFGILLQVRGDELVITSHSFYCQLCGREPGAASCPACPEGGVG
jgi:hypothetical protein